MDDSQLAQVEALCETLYTGQSVAEFDVSGALQRLFGLVRDFRIVLPQSFGMLVKTLVVLEGTARQLSPDFSLAAMIQPYYSRAVRRRFAEQSGLQRHRYRIENHRLRAQRLGGDQRQRWRHRVQCPQDCRTRRW